MAFIFLKIRREEIGVLSDGKNGGPGSRNHRDHLRSEWDLARTYARTYGV